MSLRTAAAVEERASRSWATARPTASLVIATHDRVDWVMELLALLEDQAGEAEVVLADDGSTDGTWRALVGWVARTPLPALVVRLTACGGPSVPRNTAAARARGDVLVFTDDDCLPEPGWLPTMVAAAKGALVQGCTLPLGERIGPWDRTIRVERLSGLWETCNLALPRTAFLEAGGFPVRDLLGAAGRGFGEDVLLGSAVARGLPTAFEPAAVVRHRWVPADFAEHLRSRWRLVGFPALLAEAPELRDALWHKRFLTRRSAAVDAALISVIGRRPWAAAPWIAGALLDARALPGPTGKRLVQLLLADAVGAAALVTGSARARTLLL